MKCPKCGTDNDADILFCESCDWRLDQPYVVKKTIPTMYLCVLAGIVGITAIVTYFLHVNYVPIVLGIVGMVLGSYSFTLARMKEEDNVKTTGMVLAGIGMMGSIIGFIMGLMILTELLV